MGIGKFPKEIWYKIEDFMSKLKVSTSINHYNFVCKFVKVII